MPEMFLDRADAGRQLAAELREYDWTDATVLAIPRGGVPVAVEVASRLDLPLDLVIPRKLPIPWNPEAGFGAVTGNGIIVLNDTLVQAVGLGPDQIEGVVAKVRDEIRRREEAYRGDRPPMDLSGRQAIIVDDGLASGYTMLAAVRAARKSGASRVTVAVPVASESAIRLVDGAADRVVCLIQSHRLPFAVADYYAVWHDLNNGEVMKLLSMASRRDSTH